MSAALAGWNGPLAGGVPAHQFPAGVSPQACPNYPNCNNPAVAVSPNAAAPYGGAPAAYNQGAYNPGAYNPGAYNPGAYNPGPYNGGNNALDNGQYTGDGDYHGEGLAESGAYGNADGIYSILIVLLLLLFPSSCIYRSFLYFLPVNNHEHIFFCSHVAEHI